MGYYATEHVRCKTEERNQEWNADILSLHFEGQKGWPTHLIIEKLKQEATKWTICKSQS